MSDIEKTPLLNKKAEVFTPSDTTTAFSSQQEQDTIHPFVVPIGTDYTAVSIPVIEPGHPISPRGSEENIAAESYMDQKALEQHVRQQQTLEQQRLEERIRVNREKELKAFEHLRKAFVPDSNLGSKDFNTQVPYSGLHDTETNYNNTNVNNISNINNATNTSNSSIGAVNISSDDVGTNSPSLPRRGRDKRREKGKRGKERTRERSESMQYLVPAADTIMESPLIIRDAHRPQLEPSSPEESQDKTKGKSKSKKKRYRSWRNKLITSPIQSHYQGQLVSQHPHGPEPPILPTPATSSADQMMENLRALRGTGTSEEEGVQLLREDSGEQEEGSDGRRRIGVADTGRDRGEATEHAEDNNQVEKELPQHPQARGSVDVLESESRNPSMPSQMEGDEHLRCLVARTALVLHFNYAKNLPPKVKNAKLHWLDQLTKKLYTTRNNQKVIMWKWKERLPKEVADLNPLFRQVMSWGQGGDGDGADGGPPKTWTCHRLVLHDTVLHELFSDSKIHTVQNGEEFPYDVHFDSVELLLYPLGTGLLVFHVNWIGTPFRSLTLSEIRTLLFIAKYRHRVEGVAPGWSFTRTTHPPPSEDSDHGNVSEAPPHTTGSFSESHVGSYNESHGMLPLRVESGKGELSLHDALEAVLGGRRGTRDNGPIEEHKIAEGHRHCIGEKLYNAKYCGKPVSLSSMGNWLLHHSHDDPSSPPLRLDVARHAYHHTTVVLNEEPAHTVLQEYLFHLRRAFGQTNRPPPSSEFHSVHKTSRILVWRINRYVGISREGTVSISWPLDPIPLSLLESSLYDTSHQAASHDYTSALVKFSSKSKLREMVSKSFELREWYKKFQGIYLILDLHSCAEKLVFNELSDLVASQVEDLQLSGGPDTNLGDFEMVKASRTKLRDLSSRMVRYTLSMSSNDCGGISEYSEFFTSLREIFGIPELRAELSTELKDVLALLESHYLEEEKRQRDLQEQQRLEENRLQKIAKERQDRKDQLFAVVVSIAASLSLPFSIIGGIFGMNLETLPVDVDFYGLMGVTLAISVLTLIALLMIRFMEF